MNWTPKQKQAIEERNKNILVAAAAGSGKTAVLVERIKKLIIEEGVALDKMLIVTFTNAAAAEMKEKIRTALYKEIEKDPDHSEKLREQLSLLPRANISTFHAFALDVIRRFYYAAELEPGFSICDDAQRTIMKEESLDLLLENWFAEGSEEFYDFLGWYSSHKNHQKVREIIDSTYNVLQSLPYPWQWLDEKIGELSMSPEEMKNSHLMEYIWRFIEEAIDTALDYSQEAVNSLQDAGLDRLAETVIDKELKAYELIAEAVNHKDLDGLSAGISAFSSARLVAKKDEKADYEEVKTRVKSCRDRASDAIKTINTMFFVQSLEEQIQELNQTVPKAETLRKLLLDFDRIFRGAKAQKQLMDFGDIEHFCLSILENEDAAAYYRKKFTYIFIDEYQDTNILQEEIISRIKRENNLFMVGDIKQSIYKFRLAEPEIFREKYISYGGGAENSVKIDLNQNFRSKDTILTGINQMMDNLMEDYDEDAMLYPGLSYDGEYRHIPELKVIDVSAADDVDEEIAALKNTEMEALYVSRIIKENLGRTFFDAKKGCERQLKLSDMVILMRGVKNYADVFYNVLREQGIDSFVDDSDGYFDTMEINVFMNLLSVIDNKKQDIPMISVLHSEIFKFTAHELAAIRSAHKEGAFSDAFSAFASSGSGKLQEKCSLALEKLKTWKEKSLSQPLGKFIWELLMETGYYVEMGAMPGGRQRQANLRALVDKAESYASSRQSSLYSFVRYIDAVKQRKVSMGQVKLVGENDDLVRIMTIHKSKGLEFPLVIVSGMGRKLNYTKIGRGVCLHKDIGIGMTLADYEGHWHKQTLIQKLIAKQVKKEEVQEEVRVLYVALTRARDFLYMTGTVRGSEKFSEQRELGLYGSGSYLDMLHGAEKMEIIDLNRLPVVTKTKTIQKGNPLLWDVYEETAETEEKAKEVRSRLDFIYPYEAARKLKSKYSVSEINAMGRKVHQFDTVLAVPKFRQGVKKLTAAERGTVYHALMEHLDFAKCRDEGLSYIKASANDFIKRELFTEMEISAVKLERIDEFFHSELGKRCAGGFDRGVLMRERAFDLEMELKGEKVYVQGIIDCCFEEDGELVLLDYKTNWIDPSKPFEEEAARIRASYEKQIEIYKEALEASLGKRVKESVLYLFDAGKMITM